MYIMACTIYTLIHVCLYLKDELYQSRIDPHERGEVGEWGGFS